MKLLFKRKWILIIAMIGIGGAFFLLIRPKNKTATSYQTGTVEKGTLVSTVTASGTVVSSNSLPITTQASGVISKISITNGQKVSKGQKIAEITLDSSGIQRQSQSYASYLSAKNIFANAQTNLYTLQAQEFNANQKFMNDAVARTLATTDPTYIQEQATWFAAEAAYKNQSQTITQTQVALNTASQTYQQSSPNIIALESGTIRDLTVTEGMQINAQTSSSTTTTPIQTIARIQRQGTPTISVNISEIDAPKIKPGQKATITADALPGKTFTGKVIGIDTTGTVTSGVTNYPTTILLDTNPEDLFPNMSVSANIVIAVKNDVLLIPSEAVQKNGAQSYIQVLENGKPTQVPVEVGSSSDSQTEITSGLSEGQEIIVRATTTGTSSFNRQINGGNATRSIFGGGGGAVRIGR